MLHSSRLFRASPETTLGERLRDQMAHGKEPQPLPPNTKLLQSDDLQRLLDQAREMARNGARDAARDLLAQLQNMLENLRADPFSQGMDERSREAMGMMEDMDASSFTCPRKFLSICFNAGCAAPQAGH